MTIHIGYQGGTHGHFLRYFLDRFCGYTPPITQLPFTDLGTSHGLGLKNYSDAFSHNHPHIDGWKNNSDPHIIITVNQEDILTLQRIVYIRPADTDQDLQKDKIKLQKKFADYDSIKKLYGVDPIDGVPRFILRDFCKLGFSDIQNHGFMAVDKQYRKKEFKNVHYFPVSAFWNHRLFMQQMEMLDKKFKLELLLGEDAVEIHKKFLSLFPQLKTQYRAKDITSAIKQGNNITIPKIDLIEEAYIYSWIETSYPNVLTPLTNTFFISTNEIMQYIDWYPKFYHSRNPTLPT